ncbi:MAG TPA: phosphatase PAP2 family protein [Mucilaginibacter sp.]
MQNMIRPIILISFLFFGVGDCLAQNWNVDILKAINPQNPNSSYWKNTSASAYVVPALASFGTLIYGMAANAPDGRYHAYEAFISIGVNTIISEGLKFSFNEERPADKYPGEIFASSRIHGKSFPSGHATLAFTTATTLSLEYHKWYVTVPAFLWAGSVGYSRLYLGKHYPTDVLAGAGLGIGTGYLSHWLTRQILKPYEQKNKYHE